MDALLTAIAHNIWVLIPIVAILAGSFNRWAKLQARQQDQGDLAAEIALLRTELEASRRATERRLQHLEAIVTDDQPAGRVEPLLGIDPLGESEAPVRPRVRA
jgi:hypothetical protein